MNHQPDVELVLRDYFADDGFPAPDHVLDVVEERIAREPRVLAWRLRRRPIVNTYAKFAAGLAAVVIVAFVALRLVPGGSSSGGGTSTPVPTVSPTATPTPTLSPAPSTAGATPSQTGAFGGTVHFLGDNAVPAKTVVDAVSSGATVTGTAITTSRAGIHKIRLGCAARDGDSWALGGTVEESTLAGEIPGPWSRIVVKDGPPQQISMWLSTDAAPAGIDCAAFLATFSFADLGPENFATVESGELVPPPDLAP